ncbi:carboxypeptidase regulatory-like domain-containing protein [bacterium]|nr:carboxypeptidase regulatory-like domain-containing protein [bacterium]
MLKVKLILSTIVMSIFLVVSWTYSDTFTVTNLNDSGDGSLRWAIEQANANPGPDIIDFIVSGTISPTSGLPWITDDETVIDASSQWLGPWPEGQPGITLDGTATGVVSGLGISGAYKCHIRGLFITNFGVNGVYIGPGAESNTIERNIISGNDWRGVQIEGSGANDNVVLGNYIGTYVNGTAALGNSGGGVGIEFGAQSNTIGGTGSGEGNTIAFNNGNGVIVNGIDDPDTDYNKISGNSIHDNADLGIGLVDDGNDEITAPTITSSVLTDNTLYVEGTGAGANATVEIFEADSFESSEGMTYLGSLIADESGNFSGSIDVTGKGLVVGDPVTSTTTHTNNNTSEFSSPTEIISAGSINGTVTDIEGNPIKFAFVIAINADTKDKYKAFSKLDGYYEISGLPSARYWVICIKKGYNPGVKIAKVVAGGSTTVDFKLPPKLL